MQQLKFLYGEIGLIYSLKLCSWKYQSGKTNSVVIYKNDKVIGGLATKTSRPSPKLYT